jgi:hypothetical protein
MQRYLVQTTNFAFRTSVQPVLILARASSRPAINGSCHIEAPLCAAYEITPECAIFELERALRSVVFDGPIALHRVTVEVLLRGITTMSVNRDSNRKGECSWSLKLA